MPVNSKDRPALQEVSRLLDELVPDQRPGTPGDRLNLAILDAMSDAETEAVRRQGLVIMAAISGDFVADSGCEIEWLDRAGYKAQLGDES
jgi:hypothetical protein